MRLNPYGEDPVRLATSLTTSPPLTPEELTARCVQAGVVLEQAASVDDLAEVNVFLGRWLKVVEATNPQARAALLNDLLAESSAYPRLTDHAGDGWHIHYRDYGLPVARLLRALISVGTALHLTGRGMHRLSRCELAECRNAFGDFSRGGQQRYCSPTCANRDAVRRHRAKRALAS